MWAASSPLICVSHFRPPQARTTHTPLKDTITINYSHKEEITDDALPVQLLVKCLFKQVLMSYTTKRPNPPCSPPWSCSGPMWTQCPTHHTILHPLLVPKLGWPKASSSRVTTSISTEGGVGEKPLPAAVPWVSLDPAAATQPAPRVPPSWDRAGSSSEIQNHNIMEVLFQKNCLEKIPNVFNPTFKQGSWSNSQVSLPLQEARKQHPAEQQQFTLLVFIPAVCSGTCRNSCRNSAESRTCTGQDQIQG